jgi:hypothetical protein
LGLSVLTSKATDMPRYVSTSAWYFVHLTTWLTPSPLSKGTSPGDTTRPGRDDNHSPCAKVKNESAFMACRGHLYRVVKLHWKLMTISWKTSLLDQCLLKATSFRTLLSFGYVINRNLYRPNIVREVISEAVMGEACRRQGTDDTWVCNPWNVTEELIVSLGVSRSMILKKIHGQQSARLWTAYIWLKTGFSGGLLWVL